jgi:hypothetical protein
MMAAAIPGTVASVMSRRKSVSIDNRSSAMASLLVAATSRIDVTELYQAEICPALLGKSYPISSARRIGGAAGSPYGRPDKLRDTCRVSLRNWWQIRRSPLQSDGFRQRAQPMLRASSWIVRASRTMTTTKNLEIRDCEQRSNSVIQSRGGLAGLGRFSGRFMLMAWSCAAMPGCCSYRAKSVLRRTAAVPPISKPNAR